MVIKFFLCIVAIVLTGIASWFALWCANIINYIFSIPLESVIVDILVDDSSDFMQFVYYAISTGIAYCGIFMLCFDYVYNRICCIIDDFYLIEFLILTLLVVLIIMICDPRLGSYLPNVLTDTIRNDCNFFVLGPISWEKLDFTGSKVPTMQYLVFDVAVVIAGLLSRILRMDVRCCE